MFIDILGSKWEIIERLESEDSRLKDANGFCDSSVRQIVIWKDMTGDMKDLNWFKRKVKRHEIVHAFLIESGLDNCAFSTDCWALSEEIVDWFARQGPKIYKAWEQAGALDV